MFTNQYALEITERQAVVVNTLITNLKNQGQPNLALENAAIWAPDAIVGTRGTALGFTADVYRESSTYIEAIEMKSVRPNSGEGRGEKTKILTAKAAFKLIHPTKNVNFFVGFPFDPTSPTPTGYDKERFFNYLVEFKKFFSPDEVLIGSELWDHLSGQQGTMDELLAIIRNTVIQFVTRTKLLQPKSPTPIGELPTKVNRPR